LSGKNQTNSWGLLLAAPLLCTMQLTLAGCVNEALPPATAENNSASKVGSTPAFTFDSLDARPVVSESFRGKPLVLGFISTFDLASQAQVRTLNELERETGGSVQFALIAVEDNSSRELVEAFREALSVRYPIAVATPALMRESQAFAGLRVPAVYLMDAQGKVRAEYIGIVPRKKLRDAVVALQRP
jgi:thiol-disulfide isomerase/thioredoxin